MKTEYFSQQITWIDKLYLVVFYDYVDLVCACPSFFDSYYF